jgi:hypothetical protein
VHPPKKSELTATSRVSPLAEHSESIPGHSRLGGSLAPPAFQRAQTSANPVSGQIRFGRHIGRGFFAPRYFLIERGGKLLNILVTPFSRLFSFFSALSESIYSALTPYKLLCSCVE